MSHYSKIVSHLDVDHNPRPTSASLEIGNTVARWRERDTAGLRPVAAMPDRVPARHGRLEVAAALLMFVLIGARCWGAI